MVKVNQRILIIHIYVLIIFHGRRGVFAYRISACRRTTFFCFFLFASTTILIYVFLGLFRFGFVGLCRAGVRQRNQKKETEIIKIRCV